MATPKIDAYVNWYAGVMYNPLKIVAIPPSVIVTLFRYNALTPLNELNMPHTILATVFAIPIAATVKAAGPSPKSFFPLSFINMNGTKNPIIVRKPLNASNINDGDFNRLISNIVANVRRTASEQTTQRFCSS